MPYERIADLPEAVRKSGMPNSAQALYMRVANRELAKGAHPAQATFVAWSAVKARYGASAPWLKKDATGVSAVHVDGVQWRTRPRKPRVAKGTVIKSDAARQYTLGIVYEPDTEDTQGDLATVEEIEQACWEFNRQHLGTGRGVAKRRVRKGALGIQHQDWADEHGEIIESYIAPCDLVLETPDGPQKVKKGTWLMGCIWSPENWAKIQAGELTGLSMGGSARREDA